MSTEILNHAERMKFIREQLGDLSQADLAKKIGLPKHKIADIEFGKVKISVEIAELLEEKFNIDFRWALTGKGEIQSDTEYLSRTRCLDTEQYFLLPLLSSWVKGGPEGRLLYEGVADYFPFKRFFIEKLVGNRPERAKDLYLARVRGDSMAPTINDGETILFDTNEGERLEIRTGDIYLVQLPDGSVTVKRLAMSKEAEGVRLICNSDNVAAYRTFEFRLDPDRKIQSYVLGRVRWAGKEFD